MTDWAAALTARAEAREPLTELLGAAGINWGTLLQGMALPGIALRIISNPRDDHYSGEQGLRRARVQADCISERSADEAGRIAEELIAAWRPELGEDGVDAGGGWIQDGVQFLRPEIDGPVDSGEQKELIYEHRARVDFLIWFTDEE